MAAKPPTKRYLPNCSNWAFFESFIFIIDSTLLAEEAILYCTPNGTQSILPSNFLAFTVGPTILGNSNLVDNAMLLGNLRSDFGLKAESIFL